MVEACHQLREKVIVLMLYVKQICLKIKYPPPKKPSLSHEWMNGRAGGPSTVSCGVFGCLYALCNSTAATASPSWVCL